MPEFCFRSGFIVLLSAPRAGVSWRLDLDAVDYDVYVTQQRIYASVLGAARRCTSRRKRGGLLRRDPAVVGPAGCFVRAEVWYRRGDNIYDDIAASGVNPATEPADRPSHNAVELIVILSILCAGFVR